MKYLINNECWGQGVYVNVCEICRESDYEGELKHLKGCDEVTKCVIEFRETSRSGEIGRHASLRG